ncbi:MAG TPA: class I SAM-dependent methyltransferase [Coleofasciculaceae cyanobacterium]|jgi:hypothetical protein
MVESKPQVKSGYFKSSYDSRDRFCSYWYQIQETMNAIGSEGRVLEIGPGNRFLTDYLLKRGICVETLDLREGNKPDYIGSVNKIPLADQSFELVACFQVLEHLTFEHFSNSLKEMARVASKQVVFSVPDVRYVIEIDFSFLSRDRRLQTTLSFPRITKGGEMTKHHFWEIGRPGYPLAKILSSFPPELRLRRAYRVPGNPYHHMFVCDTYRAG